MNKLMQFLKLIFDDNMLEYFNQNNGKSQEPIETITWKKEEPDKDREI